MTVSVIIAAFNSGETISRTLESILNQSRPADEIIAVDDGSTDNTAAVIKAYPGVHYVYQENRGPAAARNNGVKAAKGDYVAFLDSDDYWEEDHLSKLVAVLEMNPGLQWAATAYRKQLLTGKEKIIRLREKHYSGGNRVNYFSATPKMHFLSVISTAVSRELFIVSGGFAERYSRGEDLSLWLRLALSGPVLGYSQEPSAVYVETPHSLTAKRGDLSSLVQRITDDWANVRNHRPELMDLAWPVVKPWVSGVLIKSVRTGDQRALNMISGTFNDRLSLWQKTAIRLCGRQGG